MRRYGLLDEPSSRAATDALLAGLTAGHWRPRAWARFVLDATLRSLRQARARPRALAEVCALHLAFAALAAGVPGRTPRWTAPKWTLMSWALAAGHLGLLERRRSLGGADAVTLARANLPTFATGRWVPALALVSDLADGMLARRLGTESRFGAAADSLADAAFWTWLALRHEPDPRIRAAASLAWPLPVLAVTALGVRRGHMIDPPRPVVLRPAAALQAVLATRAVLRPTRTNVPPGPSNRRCRR
ncbi:CDP-alcohol phosphatidyltransferase [Amycolatopsis arida]|uniref:CDP-alcohol phosphatidyltransferase n=1 Tax=Amycolatopsis arida TaxID=587909 RepID=A0A1I6ARX3_9PSEU|nr:CDP-alcohol phosphatidyltransferase-like enzyme [Amycolatopsis arida]SFQ71450.1 CDP-alcohol phosphatidyltransferase [Amycolatopsis arida]